MTSQNWKSVRYQGLSYAFHPTDEIYVPSYIYKARDTEGKPYELLFDGFDGEMLYQIPKYFNYHTAHLYEENSFEDDTQLRDLTNLSSTQLDGDNFLVYGFTESAERAISDNEGYFSYTPDEEELFDQVQTYYSLERAKAFFDQYFPELYDSKLKVYTHTSLDNNAMYLPGDETVADAIYLGTNDNVFMTNLNRDSDVIIHEYAHHIIYQFLTTTYGDSLVLHEGTADFFAFVINNDPHLAETLLPGASYLRTGDLDEDRAFDDEKDYLSPHTLGQFWSSLLWDIYTELGEEGLVFITQSIYLWSTRMEMEDAVLALVEADQQQNEGKNRCKIIKLAINRGFYDATKLIDQSECGTQYYIPLPKPIESNEDPSVNCGSIGTGALGHSFFLLLLAPILTLFWRRRED